MRDYAIEKKNRVEFIRQTLASARAEGIVFGNSGGKDCALVGILCKMACENTLGVIMPCESKRNFEDDRIDAEAVAGQYGIATRLVDLTPVKKELVRAASCDTELSDAALSNIAPRLRMTALYAIAASENRLVAGTGNRSEMYMGYFTKWGDGAYDFNPIADLTATEVREFLRYLAAPASVINKAPSAGLFDGQTDEDDMGVTYEAIDRYLFTDEADEKDKGVIDRYHGTSGHKRKMPAVYKRENDSEA